MASTSAADLSVPGERTLTLPDGRTMAYSAGGAEASTRVFVALHGVFGVGCVEPHVSTVLANLGWRTFGPSLPGWGRSSPWPDGWPVAAYAADVGALLRHEMGAPGTAGAPTHLLMFGGSYGSIWAYAVAANVPPTGATCGPGIEPREAVRGMLIMGGFSPYADEAGYAAALQGMSYMNWPAGSLVVAEMDSLGCGARPPQPLGARRPAGRRQHPALYLDGPVGHANRGTDGYRSLGGGASYDL